MDDKIFLFLDSFMVHMKASTVTVIQALCIQVEFIPPGYTGLLQPVNIGYNKAFKFKAKIWTEYNGCFVMLSDQGDYTLTTHVYMPSY
jgi:hypothetical protein